MKTLNNSVDMFNTAVSEQSKYVKAFKDNENTSFSTKKTENKG